ncbi:MAG: hemerythrin domain-containing protein [Gammaproteobacteria bacterium]|nr:hemerythrin domain-containing protein [Gammaproteobacteria bacterium]
METISHYMTRDHKRCDELFIALEETVSRRDWEDSAERFRGFSQAMERHFAMEEKILFPLFETRSGNRLGPTRVMGMEHVQMRDLFREMVRALEQRNIDTYLGLSETLLIMMQQHNLKEEGVLYPLSDQMLAAERPEVLEHMERLPGDDVGKTPHTGQPA